MFRSAAAGVLGAAWKGMGAANSAPGLSSVPCRGLMRDFRKSFRILRDRPVGPYKLLAPGVKDQGRVGPTTKDGEYRRKVHYPKDGKYTIKPLPMSKMGGRDPATGRKVIEGVGGGSKQRYRWVDWLRLPADWDRDGPDLVEKVVEVRYDPVRKAKIALTGWDGRLRWQVATENMKEGDLIRTTCKIPKIPVKPEEGNSYPLGALPNGTTVCLVQKLANEEPVFLKDAEQSGTVLRQEGSRTVVKFGYSGHDYSFDQRCQCVVGKVSIHPLKALVIGSPNRSRWMGNRPRSGLWNRKTGRFGRKIKKPPPVKEIRPEVPERDYTIWLTHLAHGRRGMPKLTKIKATPDM